MSKRALRNAAHSINQRLRDEAKRTGRPFNELLQYFAMERFLYRLCRSPHGEKFVLKGALLFTAWQAPMYRPTRDIDLLGRMGNSLDEVVGVFQDICRQEVEPDGLGFDVDQVTAERIIEDADYEGVRVTVHGRLGNAEVAFHVDIGFWDVIVPGPVDLDYPTILHLPAPRLRGYSRESVIAEKFEAMVKLGEVNSRMKDFHDTWYLARHFDFDGADLAKALVETFSRRRTTLQAKPLALSPKFARDDMKQTQWVAFLRRGRLAGIPDVFEQVLKEIAGFLLPVSEAVAAGTPFEQRWVAPGPWKPVPDTVSSH
ncbi:MAG: nucleotidyl transferase AbiEii/AbiGii toxin family protein [Phycisphaerae bacterium]|nr:nucleotidyl transferase AbiEii/AbiGii toxin family protein [Phycisphaerae bacterium]